MTLGINVFGKLQLAGDLTPQPSNQQVTGAARRGWGRTAPIGQAVVDVVVTCPGMASVGIGNCPSLMQSI